jgi:hypothetical protein
MITQWNHEQIAECDGCHTTLDTNTSDFRAALEVIKDAGWRVCRAGDGWGHFCPVCA